VQGVCSCFSLFNLQGALRSFANRSSSASLMIISQQLMFVKNFFQKFSTFFLAARMRRFLDAGVMIPNGAKKVNTFFAEKLSKSAVENLCVFKRSCHLARTHSRAQRTDAAGRPF
ncbi:MAG: hypothetical protein ACI3VP_06485, partial [Oscillospiraceae bacterium]